MARPKQVHPTPAELEVLQILWKDGPATVRQLMEKLDSQRPRGYTSLTSLLDTMFEKKLVRRKPQGRAFLYSPKIDQSKTLSRMVGDLLSRAFHGSTSALVSHLLDHVSPCEDELQAIREAIESHERSQGGE